jgi:hypothetical protein
MHFIKLSTQVTQLNPILTAKEEIRDTKNLATWRLDGLMRMASY